MYGQYYHSLDAKNRFRLPKQLKNGTSYVIAKGNEGCLFLFDANYFNQTFMAKLDSIPTFDVQANKALRLFMSSCFEVTEDNQGRMLMPSALKNYAEISKDIVLIGVGNRVEIWAQEKWESYSAKVDFDSATDALNKYSL